MNKKEGNKTTNKTQQSSLAKSSAAQESELFLLTAYCM